MSEKMPERVWLDENKAVRSNALYVPVTEYLRADLYTALESERDALKERVARMQGAGDAPVSGGHFHPLREPRLAAWEAASGEEEEEAK